MQPDPLFPTRTQPVQEAVPGAAIATEAVTREEANKLAGSVLLARLNGLDPPQGRPLKAEERTQLADPFAKLLLTNGIFPLTLAELLLVLSRLDGTPDGLPGQRMFVIAEAGQIFWNESSSRLPRGVRYVVTRNRNGDTGADILVSTRPPSDSREAFLQVAAWDNQNRVFQYYERIGETWFWEGNSWHALSEPTRGHGPFDSHVNGAPVMKELKLPWLHWDSGSQGIPLESFPPDHPLHTDPLFQRRESAELLEKQIVRPAISRWTRARLDHVLSEASGVMAPEALLRHITSATTVNITSSTQRSVGLEAELDLPLTFFFDRDALVNRLGLEVPIPRIMVARGNYESALVDLGIALRHKASGFVQPGDAFFAWPVPERALEDQLVTAELVRRGILSASFVLALLLVDFPNPLDSPARESLLAYVPSGPLPVSEIEPRMRAAIERAAANVSPEAPPAVVARALALDEPKLRSQAVDSIGAFLQTVQRRAATRDGVLDYMRLAAVRRRAFRRRKIAEFDLSLPFSAVIDDGPALALLADGTVVQRDDAVA